MKLQFIKILKTLSLTCFLGVVSSAMAQSPSTASFMQAPASAADEPTLRGLDTTQENLKQGVMGALSQIRPSGHMIFRFQEFSPQVGQSTRSFLFREARAGIKGKNIGPLAKFALEVEFGGGDVMLKNYYGDLKLPHRQLLRFGQWKVPMSRAIMASSSKLEFTDTSILENAFEMGRDLGIGVHNNYGASPKWEYFLGVFNAQSIKGKYSGLAVVDPNSGEGDVSEIKRSNAQTKMKSKLVARGAYNSPGMNPYTEGDFKGGPLRYSVGVGGQIIVDGEAGDITEVKSVDFAMKLHGLSFSWAAYASAIQLGTGFPDRDFHAVGSYAQAGYLINQKFQPVFRFATLVPDGENDDVSEVTFGFNVYLMKHRVKWMNSFTVLRKQDPDFDQDDLLVKSQLVFGF